MEISKERLISQYQASINLKRGTHLGTNIGWLANRERHIIYMLEKCYNRINVTCLAIQRTSC